ncbi:MAG: polyprenyl synthetase family protein [Nitrospirota bacterium]
MSVLQSYSEAKLIAYLQQGQSDINKILDEYFPQEDKSVPLYQAIRYSLFAGGKYLRSNLCLAACEAVGGSREAALPFAAALELIHTYSLVHDDLPAMDNDDLRRGKPTSHKVYGEATAILVGDALLTESFRLIAQKGMKAGASPEVVLQAIVELASGAGLKGMVLGQFLDIQSEGPSIMGEKELSIIHRNKTGALIRAAVRMGAILGNAKPTNLQRLTQYGESVGLSFQIMDDILDLMGEEEELGKRIGQDTVKEKWTYPRLIGIEESVRRANRLSDEAIVALEPFGQEAMMLRGIAMYAINRKK